MSKRKYEDYAKVDCIPVGYNEAVTEYIFSQSDVDMLLDRIECLQEDNVALYSALYEVLEKIDSDNVASRIDQLTKQNNAELCDIFKCFRVNDRLRAEKAELEKEFANTEAQNKRVLEKLELIVRDNQDLQKQITEREKEIELLKKQLENAKAETEVRLKELGNE